MSTDTLSIKHKKEKTLNDRIDLSNQGYLIVFVFVSL